MLLLSARVGDGRASAATRHTASRSYTARFKPAASRRESLSPHLLVCLAFADACFPRSYYTPGLEPPQVRPFLSLSGLDLIFDRVSPNSRAILGATRVGLGMRTYGSVISTTQKEESVLTLGRSTCSSDCGFDRGIAPPHLTRRTAHWNAIPRDDQGFDSIYQGTTSFASPRH